MTGNVVSFTGRKPVSVNTLGADFSMRVVLMPDEGVEPLDECLYDPLMALIKRWMRRELEDMRGSYFTHSAVVGMLMRVLDGLPLGGKVHNLPKHKIKDANDVRWRGQVHWYYDAGGMLSLGRFERTGPLASVTYHPLVAGYYVQLPDVYGEIRIMRISD